VRLRLSLIFALLVNASFALLVSVSFALLVSVSFALLVSDLARADELERPLRVASAADAVLPRPATVLDPPELPVDPHARFARDLEARVADVLARRAELAAERAVALLEARAGDPDLVARSAASRVEPRVRTHPFPSTGLRFVRAAGPRPATECVPASWVGAPPGP